MQLKQKDLDILNSKYGLKQLFANEKIDIKKVLRYACYEKELEQLQVELVKMQQWVQSTNAKVIVLFEGRDLAGKGGAIRRITARINPRFYRIEALDIPTLEEEQQWYFQRYVNKLPSPGEMVFFDRSWYNRAILEPVNGFCSTKDYQIFMDNVNYFEKMLVESDTYLIKFYFSITKEEQNRRLQDIENNPLKRWKLSKIDEKIIELWDEYTDYKEKMFDKTNTNVAPWSIIKANRKTQARLTAIKILLDNIPYQS